MKANKIYRNCISILLCVLILLLSLSIMSVDLRAESPYFTGEGTEASPYVINTTDDLLMLASLVNSGDYDYLNKHYLLNNDIDLSSAGNWTPIGGDYTFGGTFDGGGHEIKGMSINVTVSSGNIGHIGLFGSCSGTVKNLGITQSNITAVCSSSSYIGSIIGYATNAHITNCYSTADISATGNTLTYCGGICGYSLSSDISDCYNIGSIYGKEAGGIVGNSTNGAISRCYNAGGISAWYYAGGLVGTGSADFTDCYNDGDVGSSSDTDYAGGIIGESDAYCLIQNCRNTGEVKSSESNGAIIGWDTSSCNLVSCYYLDNNTQAVGSPSLTGNIATLAQMQSQSTYTGYDFTGVWIMPLYDSFPYLRSCLVHPVCVTITGDESSVQIGQAINLFSDVLPINATDKKVNWSSSNTNIAQVDNNGRVTGVSKGSLTITASTLDGARTDTFSVTVTDIIVSFETDGGSATDDVYCGYNETVARPAIDPEKDGCTFSGWYKENTYTTEWDFENDKITAPTTIYAKWTANTYNVTFDSKDGSAVDSTTAVFDTLLTSPEDPEKAGYTFAGWYKDEDFTLLWTFNTDKMPSHDIVLYAKWGAQLCTVNFDTDGGSGIDSVYAYYDDLVCRPSDPEKTGYTFAGWYKDEELTQLWNFTADKVYAEDICIYAKYNINKYSVHFESNGGSEVYDIDEAEFDSLLERPSDPHMTEHAFLGWYKDQSLTQIWDFDYDKMPADNITLWAKWKINTYIVTFNSNGGSAVNNIIADYNTTAAQPTAPQKTGYIFAGWYKDASFTELWDFDSDKVTINITLNAKWVNKLCTVSFWSMGGSSVSSVKVVIDSKISAPVQPVRTGYKFLGWYKDYLLTDKWIFSSDIVKSDISLYAGWIKAEYADYNINDYLKIQTFLNLPSSIPEFTNGQALNALYNQNDPSTWSGVIWSGADDKRAVSIDFSGKGLSGEMDLSGCDALLSVDCSSNALQTLNVSGCLSLANLSCDNNMLTQINVNNCAAIINLNCGGNNLSQLDISQNTAITDLSCENNAIGSIDINLNTALSNADLSSNKLKYIDLSDNNSLASINLSGNEITHIKLNISSSLKHIYAYGNGYIYLYDENYSSSSYVYSYPYGGSSLYHWFDGSTDKGNSESFMLSEIEYASLTAQFNPVTVKFASNGGGAINDAIVNYDNTVTRPSDPVKQGSEFLGWYKDTQFLTLWDFDYDTVSENITLYAKWSNNNVVFESNGGSNVDNIQLVPFGEKISSPENVTRKYYSLNGWKYLDENNNWQMWDFDNDAVCKDITLYADWTYSSYTISASANNTSYGSVEGGGIYDANGIVILKATPKSGCRFVRWTDGENELSKDYIYIFNAIKDKTAIAEFAYNKAPVFTSVASYNYSTILLKWTASQGASSYKIYRATSASGSYKYVATTSRTYYYNKGLSLGKYYYFKIKAVCVSADTTTYSQASSYKKARPLPAKPSNVSVYKYSKTAAVIKYSKVSKASGYRIYRATSYSGTYKLVRTTTSTKYTNYYLKRGKTYYYKVRAYQWYKGKKYYSPYTSIVKIKM